MNIKRDSTDRRSSGRAFTLIELIVVITVIAILMTIGLLSANHIRGNSQTSVTRDLIRSLDTAYSGMVQEKSANVPATYRDNAGNEFAVIDAVVNNQTTIEPSLGLFVLAAGSDSAITTAILRADQKYVENKPLVSMQTGWPAANAAPSAPVLKDAWGKPIRFVHPRYAGGYGDYEKLVGTALNTESRDRTTLTLKRAGNSSATIEFVRSYDPTGSMPAADEGLCGTNVGYFYSAGPDSNGGTRDNNVYTTVPKFPSETAKLSPPPAGT